ncbi:hypothetical protein CU669_00855 [Paramagnetospirillum kuznetsovii]|uniref:Protein SirB1 N-terminal domain-containing protein n=1 Tax=Paramagnetospirillum kuznetsovii TaxID=2053833 RepID=A0A364P316_9PROT|nr:transglutaminase-like domain-containing protein [Paramagnetospirillum kuznetsovii]RAU23686.1 hypothetical protein CU669_00855 [Paramagnetospirillum kuznetsovii]
MPKAARDLQMKLSALGRLADPDLRPAEALLLLAALDCPECEFDGYRGFLDGLAEDVRTATRGVDGALPLAEAIFQVLGHAYGFRGDHGDDDDISNSNLIWVIEHRQGVGGILAVLAMDAARLAGLNAHVLAFPAHMLLRLEDEGGRRVILDPLLDGQPVEPPGMRALLKAAAGNAAELEPSHYTAMGNRDLVVRLQNDAKLRLLRCGQMERALRLVEATLLVAPETCMLWREAGLMHLRLNNPSGAVAALEQFVARTTNAMARARTQSMLAELKSRLS